MHIEHRNPTPEYPPGGREEKTLLVLSWLLEFRWSSFELLATRLGLRSKTSYKFFRALVEEGLIQIFKSVPANIARCFLLTWRGAIQLQDAGRDISHAYTSLTGVTHDPAIIHDLAVQAAVLRRLQQYDEVLWKPQISLPEPFEKPDVLLRSPQGAWVALDYERQRKDDSRIYITFRNHAEAIMNQHYRGVYLLFDRPADLERYRTLFDAEAWPEYDFDRKKGKITARTTTFTPDTVPPVTPVLCLHPGRAPTRRPPAGSEPLRPQIRLLTSVGLRTATRTRTPQRHPEAVRLVLDYRGAQARRMGVASGVCAERDAHPSCIGTEPTMVRAVCLRWAPGAVWSRESSGSPHGRPDAGRGRLRHWKRRSSHAHCPTVIPYSNIPEPSTEKSCSSSWTGSWHFGSPPFPSWPDASA